MRKQRGFIETAALATIFHVVAGVWLVAGVGTATYHMGKKHQQIEDLHLVATAQVEQKSGEDAETKTAENEAVEVVNFAGVDAAETTETNEGEAGEVAQ